MTAPHYDPTAIVLLVIRELAEKDVKSSYLNLSITDAAEAASALLEVLGVTPVRETFDGASDGGRGV